MKLWAVALLAIGLAGCGYKLVGVGSDLPIPAILDQGLSVDIADPLGQQARLISQALERRGLNGSGATLVIEQFDVQRREISDFSDRTEYELRAVLTWGLQQGEDTFLIGPETLRRDSLLVLLDSNSDTLDRDLQSQRSTALYQDLIGLMLDRLNAQATALGGSL